MKFYSERSASPTTSQSGVQKTSEKKEVMKLIFKGKNDQMMIDEITSAHEYAISKLSKFCPITLDKIDNITVFINSRMRVMAGTAQSTYRLIAMNYKLHLENPDQIRSTYLHEFAHIISDIRHNTRTQHDCRWKEVMVAMGQEPEVYHNMDVTHHRRRHRRWKYKCDCGKHELTTVRHRRHQRSGEQTYFCRSCKNMLKYEG